MIEIDNTIDIKMDSFLYAFNKLKYRSIYWDEKHITKDKIFMQKFKASTKGNQDNCFASFVGKTQCYINYIDNEKGFVPLFKVFFFRSQDGTIVAKRKHQKISKKARTILYSFAFLKQGDEPNDV